MHNTNEIVDNYIRNAGYIRRANKIQDMIDIFNDKGKTSSEKYKDDYNKLINDITKVFAQSVSEYINLGYSEKASMNKAFKDIESYQRKKIKMFNKKHKVFIKFINIKAKLQKGL